VKVAEADMLQSELQRLREDNADLKRRLADVPSLETAKKNADARADQLEQKMEDMLKERVAAKEAELNATYDERLRNYEDRCVSCWTDLWRGLICLAQRTRLAASGHTCEGAVERLARVERVDTGQVARSLGTPRYVM